MLVKVLKNGAYAFGGVRVVDLVMGESEFAEIDGIDLIRNGWGEIVKDDVKETTVIEEAIEVENITKKKAWSHVKFKGIEKAVSVRTGENDEETIKLAIEKLNG